VDADVIRLAQVIGNLLTNAAKYTVRPGRIMVTARREGDDAVIRVRDPGIGITADVLPHIFDLFVQGKQTLARSAGGLGIGLTLVRRLVEMHGGHVSAFSAGPGEGSEFVVTLPAVPAPIDASPNGSDQRHEYRHPAVGKVLVVDDNIDACESIALILEMAGYDARCVNDGPSVLREALEYRPDAIVLDIGLPGMSGYEVAAQLRQHPAFSDTPLVAATGYGQERDRRQAKQAGFDAHLVKPIDAHALRAFLDEVIRRTR
jgi:CheY-like chemotaxis protein